jgi:hypothetical protein
LEVLALVSSALKSRTCVEMSLDMEALRGCATEASWKDVLFRVFHDGKAIGTSLAVMIAGAAVAVCIGIGLNLKSYQKDFVEMHGAHSPIGGAPMSPT